MNKTDEDKVYTVGESGNTRGHIRSFVLREVVPGRYTLIAIENGWDLDGRSPEAIARYLPAGQRVTVEETSSQAVHRTAPVELQPR